MENDQPKRYELCSDHSTEGIFGTDPQSDEESPEHDPTQDIHSRIIKSSRALNQAQCTEYHYYKLQSIQLPSPVSICKEAKYQLAQQRASQCDGIDIGFMVSVQIAAPVDIGKAGKDNVCCKEVIRVRKEARSCHGPDLPVEAIGIDVAAYLVAFVDVCLERIQLVKRRDQDGAVAKLRTSWCLPTSVGLIQILGTNRGITAGDDDCN